MLSARFTPSFFGLGGVVSIRFTTSAVRCIFSASVSDSSRLGSSGMPAQPLSNVNPSAKVIIGPEAASHYPKLAALVAEAIAAWSQVEMALGELLVAMLGANAIPAISMYNALTSSVAQLAAVKAAAATSLDIDDKDLFDALLSRHKPLAKARNRFAHWAWAYSPDIPKTLLFCDPTSLADFSARNIDGFGGLPSWCIIGASAGNRRDDVEFPRFNASAVYVYQQQDLQEIIKETRAPAGHWSLFHMLLVHRFPVNEIHERLRQILSSEPRTAEALSRLRGGRKTSPPTPPPPPLSDPPEKG